jgi:type II secretory pathway pseudopilin PulG
MKRKKGFLLGEETLKLVVALLCIVFLIGFLAALYFSFSNTEKEKQAQATLERLKEAINQNAQEFTVYNPKDWLLIGWPVQGEEAFPRVCSQNEWKYCICIFDAIYRSAENYAEESKICVETQKRVLTSEPRLRKLFTPSEYAVWLRDPPIDLQIMHGNEITITRKPI